MQQLLLTCAWFLRQRSIRLGVKRCEHHLLTVPGREEPVPRRTILGDGDSPVELPTGRSTSDVRRGNLGLRLSNARGCPPTPAAQRRHHQVSHSTAKVQHPNLDFGISTPATWQYLAPPEACCLGHVCRVLAATEQPEHGFLFAPVFSIGNGSGGGEKGGEGE